MSLIIGLVIVLLIIVLFLKFKQKKIKTNSGNIVDDKTKDEIIAFFNEIVEDYHNEYRINYLSARYNIKELESDTSYVFKTKRIGSLIDILDYSQIPFGEKYLEELIIKKYNVIISNDNRLPFLIEISRINGKIKAVESVKEVLSGDDYKRLITELEDDILYYKNKYSTSV